jgi:base plate protein
VPLIVPNVICPIMANLNSSALLAAWEEGVSQPPLNRGLTLLAMARPERSADEWACVSIGERDRSLLQLREALFGSTLESIANCPECAERLEVNFSTREIGVSPAGLPAPDDDLVVEAEGYAVICRLPTSADLLEISTSFAADLRAEILNRCIKQVQVANDSIDPEKLPETVVSKVIDSMAKADPQADVQVAMACPACSHSWSLPFDILTYLWSEIEDWARRLLLEVHMLASVYGWSEWDILAMSSRRRRIYLDMLGT